MEVVARRRRTAGWALALALSGACATGSGEPDTTDDDALEPPTDDVQAEVDAGVVTAPEVGVTTDAPSLDAGRDAGFDVGVDVGFDVGFDLGFDVPLVCVGATSQRCGSCGTQARSCTAGAWSAWGACVEPALALAGDWRLALTPPGGGAPSTSLAWFAADGSGGAVDAYGYAELTAVTADACAPALAYTKHYLVGSSTGRSFRYSGAWTVGPPPSFAGTWADVSDATNASTFTAQARAGRAPATFAGAWRLMLDWAVTSTTLTVGAGGGLSGTMVDTYGTAALQGAVDLADGTVMFVKNYTSGTSMGQQYLYTGTVDAAGTAITGGAWSAQGSATLSGTWTAAR